MELFTAILYVCVVVVAYKILDHLLRIPRVGQLSDKYILVTGCDSGFGHEIAKRLDKLGCHVFATCLTEKGETELKKQCSNRVHTLSMDVTKSSSIKLAYEKVGHILPSGKGLWAVLNNAGIGAQFVPDDWFSLEEYQRLLDVNLLGTIDVTMTFLPLVKREGGGRIVITSSMAGRASLVKATPYFISKYGLEAFSDSIRRQFKVYDIGVHIIEPGSFKTNITDSIRTARQIWNDLPRHVRDEYGEGWIDKMEEALSKSKFKFSDRISDVTDAYEHALLGLYPRARYVVGTEAKMAILVCNYTPEWFSDWMVNKMLPCIVPKAARDGRYK